MGLTTGKRAISPRKVRFIKVFKYSGIARLLCQNSGAKIMQSQWISPLKPHEILLISRTPFFDLQTP